MNGSMGGDAHTPAEAPQPEASASASVAASATNAGPAATPEEALRNAYGAPSAPETAADAAKAESKRTGPRTPQRSKAVTSTGARKASAKSSRSRAREFALQALYQHLVGRNSAEAIDSFTRDLSGFHKADAAHYDAVLHGCIDTGDFMDELITPLLDRKMAEISPIEHACMWMGVYEFQHCLDVPWRVVLNEYIELTKEFGGTDGHKYVNAVLSALSPSLRSAEVQADVKRSNKSKPPAQSLAPSAPKPEPGKP